MIVGISETDTAVILVNYNGYEDTIECVNSIRDAIYQVCVIVVDNASPNNDFEKLIRVLSDVIVLYSKTNAGFSSGNNIGIKYVMSKDSIRHIILLNNDTIIDKEFFVTLKSDPAWDSAVLVPRMMYFHKPDQIWYAGGNLSRKTGRTIHKNMNKNVCHQDLESVYCLFATGCCMAIPTKIIKKIGLLDERYFMYCEDSEYCLRMQANNVKIKYIGKAVLWHKVGNSSGGSMSAFSTYYTNRNRIFYIKRYRSYFSSFAMLFFYITRIIRIMQYTIQRKTELSRSILYAIRDGRRCVYGKGDL